MINTINDLLKSLNCDAIVEVDNLNCCIAVTTKSEGDKILVENKLYEGLPVAIGKFYKIDPKLHITGALVIEKQYKLF